MRRDQKALGFFDLCRDVEYCTIIDATEKHGKSMPMLLTKNQNHC